MAQTANNNIAPRKQAYAPIDDSGQKATTFLTSGPVQALLLRLYNGDQQMAARIVTTTVAIVAANPALQNCPPMEILAGVLRGEVGMGLSYAHSEYAIVPYKGHAQFQPQYQGITQAAYASGAFVDADVYDVRQGEYKGLDRLTRRPVIEWMEDDEKREALPIVGYYAFYQLVDKPPHYGRFRSIYWSHEKILQHADTYSQAFRGKEHCNGLKKYQAMLRGELKPETVDYLRSGSAWFCRPDEEPHIKMCKKTVIKQLFKLPGTPHGVAADRMLSIDDTTEKTDEPITFADEYDRLAKEAALSYAIENHTAQIEAPATAIPSAPEAPAEVNPAPPAEVQPAPQAPAPEPARRSGPKKAQEAAPVSGNGSTFVRQPDFPSMGGNHFPTNDESEALW